MFTLSITMSVASTLRSLSASASGSSQHPAHSHASVDAVHCCEPHYRHDSPRNGMSDLYEVLDAVNSMVSQC
jgi:hypothetical protein